MSVWNLQQYGIVAWCCSHTN